MLTGKIKANFFGKYLAPKRAMAVMGAKLAGWGKNRAMTPKIKKNNGTNLSSDEIERFLNDMAYFNSQVIISPPWH